MLMTDEGYRWQELRTNWARRKMCGRITARQVGKSDAA
jgi:hypothetical protein